MAPILKVENLQTQFNSEEGLVHAVNGISYQLNTGEILGIVGESGSGKSVSVLSLMGLIPQPPAKITGTAFFEGKDLLQLSDDELRKIRGNKVAMIFQDPMTSLNPVLTIGEQIREAIEEHTDLNEEATNARIIELLSLVGIPTPEDRVSQYPHQFSGGMRQRAMIAIGLACAPQLLIADEPTTALDVTIQAQIVDLVKRLQDEIGMAVIWITHDLGVVAGLVNRVAVMYAGYIVETAPVKTLYKDPRHPYTLGLLGSLPRLDEDTHQPLVSIDGMPPDLIDYPTGCPFAPRCTYVIDRCQTENPTLQSVGDEHQSACWVEIQKEG
ncbi:MAG: ABC transporter ATP-binding protein [Anaerolineae bacterium]|jgi:oligopeptide transport system ATP-binding protein|nr:ABC transporter ATP-binding protein [Anaerolineae bacterium]MBT7326335.1 ABC transporter ATP-binding protein [Anaerolineae bacterium]